MEKLATDGPNHWDEAYRTRGDDVSWFEAEPSLSLDLIELLDIDPSTPVIDVGGGRSFLVDRLVDRGFADVSVLDISREALSQTRRRLGDRGVHLLHHDVLSWVPERRFGLWHDRALFHFIVDAEGRRRYLSTLTSAMVTDGGVVLATFAEDGPESCSGLPVARYSTGALIDVLGPAFTIVSARRELHTTPSGATQPFTWLAVRFTPRGNRETDR